MSEPSAGCLMHRDAVGCFSSCVFCPYSLLITQQAKYVVQHWTTSFTMFQRRNNVLCLPGSCRVECCRLWNLSDTDVEYVASEDSGSYALSSQEEKNTLHLTKVCNVEKSSRCAGEWIGDAVSCEAAAPGEAHILCKSWWASGPAVVVQMVGLQLFISSVI